MTTSKKIISTIAVGRDNPVPMTFGCFTGQHDSCRYSTGSGSCQCGCHDV